MPRPRKHFSAQPYTLRRDFMSYVKIGVGGPVGSGKTALIERLTRKMLGDYSICVITNDIYTKEDAEFLIKNSALDPERIMGVETGGCPHTAIREDCSMNLEAVDEMTEKFPDVQIVFIESGGDNLSATFSPNLADATIYVIDVAQGEKIKQREIARRMVEKNLDFMLIKEMTGLTEQELEALKKKN